ncbi:MAG: hypothetical protein KIT84_43350 [Labilithrix sp.]|nr:hypothetical protein [Labilithrix sp.]MCW5817915.1 hypothetical protein [Labilithrix sp.]
MSPDDLIVLLRQDPELALRLALRERLRAVRERRVEDAAEYAACVATCALDLDKEALRLRFARRAAGERGNYGDWSSLAEAAEWNGFVGEAINARHRARDVANARERLVEDFSAPSTVARLRAIQQHEIVTWLGSFVLCRSETNPVRCLAETGHIRAVAEREAVVVTDEGRILGEAMVQPAGARSTAHVDWSGVGQRLIHRKREQVAFELHEEVASSVIHELARSIRALIWIPARQTLIARRGQIFVPSALVAEHVPVTPAVESFSLARAFFQIGDLELAKREIGKAKLAEPDDEAISHWYDTILNWSD